MKAKVHRIVLLVVDHELMTDNAMREVIENCRYAYPTVLEQESRDVDWDDDHPLNKRDTQADAVRVLFGQPPTKGHSV